MRLDLEKILKSARFVCSGEVIIYCKAQQSTAP